MSGFSSFASTSTSTSSFSSPSHHPSQPVSTINPHHHQVPFGSIPGSQPGVLSWGFGMSSANRGGTGWTTTPFGGARMTPPNVAWGSQSPTTQSQSNSRRRRRSDTPPEREEQQQENEQRQIRQINNSTTKRARKITTTTTSEGLANGLAGSLSLGSNTPSNSVEDLGKSLASLDKSSLLSIFSSLLSTHPHLNATLTSLLPSPTLSQSLTHLTSLTTQILSSIPRSTSSAYVHSRLRLPLENFIQESRKLLNTYIPSTLPPGKESEELYHPTTSMTLLLHLTSSILTISQSLPPASSDPSPLQSNLLPSLMNSYHVLITRLSDQVNSNGRILAQSTINSWFTELCQLVEGTKSCEQQLGQERKALEGVLARLRREIGWLVGWREENLVQGQGGGGQGQGQGGMEGVEEEL